MGWDWQNMFVIAVKRFDRETIISLLETNYTILKEQ